MRQRQRRCSAKRRSWAYTRHSLGAASRCVEGVAPRAVGLARPPSGSAGAAADRRCASRPYSYASCRRACARRRGRERGAGAARRRPARPSGSTVAARQPHGAVLARRGAWMRCSRAHARPGVADVAPSAVDLGPAVGRPIVLKDYDKQHAEDERHNEAPARAWREECTTDGLRE